MQKIKRFWKKNKRTIIVGAIACPVIFAAGCFVGRDMFIERLIHAYENSTYDPEKWTFMSSDKKHLGDLMYEIRVENIGD